MKAKTKSSNKSHNRHFSNIPKNETKPEKKTLRYSNIPAAVLIVAILAISVFIIAKQFDKTIVGKSFEQMYFEQNPSNNAQDNTVANGVMRIQVNIYDGAIPKTINKPIKVSVLKVGSASPIATRDIIGSGIIEIPSGSDFYYVKAIDSQSAYLSYNGYDCRFMNLKGTYSLNNICLNKNYETGCGSCD